jgi:Ca2+-binding EF-hand superfamily protein
MDINDDGIVSIEEFQPPMEVRLSRADADNDGAVTLEELNQHRADREAQHVERQANHADQMTQRFLAMDIDGSGGVTPDEARLAAFHHMDSDQNGSLSVDELRRPEERKGKGGKGKHRNL